ncbi:MAG: hypothetical protein EXX96DRAFT_562041 [Benjaminiella poitrasii]|nr:MAG: hypothetical protein EXX96DRAFT_562041 [Benjaminiella poitrasii]
MGIYLHQIDRRPSSTCLLCLSGPCTLGWHLVRTTFPIHSLIYAYLPHFLGLFTINISLLLLSSNTPCVNHIVSVYLTMFLSFSTAFFMLVTIYIECWLNLSFFKEKFPYSLLFLRLL